MIAGSGYNLHSGINGNQPLDRNILLANPQEHSFTNTPILKNHHMPHGIRSNFPVRFARFAAHFHHLSRNTHAIAMQRRQRSHAGGVDPQKHRLPHPKVIDPLGNKPLLE